jgi:Domain of unknown function (DUF4395)
MINFGETVAGYNIPVLNEREIRASAGLLFLVLFASIMQVHFEGDFLLLKYFVTVFLTDMIIRVFVNPTFSPSLILGRLIVGKQVPEYVGAPQKKFTWKIGLVLAASMFFFLVILNLHSFITAVSCLACLLFLFFESAFGICLGCLFYRWYYKEKAEYCPGEICDAKAKQDIQKISRAQIAIIFCFVVFVLSAILLFNDAFSKKPNSLSDVFNSLQFAK